MKCQPLFRKSLIGLFCAGLLLTWPALGQGATLYVSPDGDDGNPGTRGRPLRTLQGARDRVRSLRTDPAQDVVVLFKAGDYFIDETVRLGKEDSGANGHRVLYKNRDEKGSANLIGGRALRGWKDEGGGIYSIQLDRDAYALYENDQPAVLAREPDEGYHEFEAVTDFSHLKFRESDYGRFDYHGAAVRLWAHWIPGKIAIHNIDFDRRIVTLQQPYPGNLQGTVWNDEWAARTRTRFYIYNARTFLDQPGEFYMDPTSHRLYYKPRRTPIEEQAIIAATVDRIISIDGASDIQFEGLTFKVSNGLLAVIPSLPLDSNIRGGLIHLGTARNIIIQYCRLLNSGQNGVVVEGDIEKCLIYGNLITHTASGGVRFVGGNNRDNTIENNYVHHVGEGIYVRNSVGDVIRHNRIHDVDENGFKSLYVERQTVSYNDISRVGLDGTDSDAAGIYTNCTAGGPDGGHVMIDHNLLHDMAHNGYPGYPAAAIYLDLDGVYNCTVTNNIIYSIEHKYGVHVRGPNHIVRNNIIDFDGPDLLAPFTLVAGGRRANIAVDKPPIWNHHYIYENNIVWTASGSVFQLAGSPDRETFQRVDNNVYYNPDGQYSFGRIKGWDTWDRWRGRGLDANTRCADPLFVDRKNHDYRLQPGSPALALGFQEIDTRQIGLKPDFPYLTEGASTGKSVFKRSHSAAWMDEPNSYQTCNVDVLIQDMCMLCDEDAQRWKQFIDARHRQGKLVSAEMWPATHMNELLEYVMNDESLQAAACVDLDGRPIKVPWMVGHIYQGRMPAFLCSNQPRYRQFLRDQVRYFMAAGADGIMVDDGGGAFFAFGHNGGFCPYCMEGFRKCLAEKYTAEQLRQRGVDDLDSFDYRQFVLRQTDQGRSYRIPQQR